MRILHLFNYPLKNIIPMFTLIKEQGFDSVQINPLQPLKENGFNAYWVSYQICGFTIGNDFGSKQELEELCKLAHEYGIKIFADVVLLHMAGRNDGALVPHEKVEALFCNNRDFWMNTENVKDWNDRRQVLHGNIGLPRLNLNHPDVQTKIIDYCNELIDCGIDGFRFDAIKSVALPEDYPQYVDEQSSFIPNLIYSLKKYGLFLYGEVLMSPENIIDLYAKYMNVLTDSIGSDSSKLVKFVESHDSFLSEDMAYTKGFSADTIVYHYRDLCYQYENTLFYARPFDNHWQSNLIRNAHELGKMKTLHK